MKARMSLSRVVVIPNWPWQSKREKGKLDIVFANAGMAKYAAR
jgi:hypothetical protein